MTRKNQGSRCRDCREKYAQEMGLCRTCQKKRLGNEGALSGPTFALSELKKRAAAKGIDLHYEPNDGVYTLVSKELAVFRAHNQRTVNRFITEYLPPPSAIPPPVCLALTNGRTCRERFPFHEQPWCGECEIDHARATV